MAKSITIGPIPKRSAFKLDPNGILIAWDWVNWLQNLANGVNQNNDDAVNEAFDSGAIPPSQQSIGPLAQAQIDANMPDAPAPVAAFFQAINDLRVLVASIIEYTGQNQATAANPAIQELYNLIATQDVMDRTWIPRVQDLQIQVATLIEYVGQSASGSSGVLQDTHANRLASYPATNYAVGTLFLETDRTYVYVVRLVGGVNTWVFVTGIDYDLLANIPGDLGSNDVNALFASTDWQHIWRWHGNTWHFLEGDSSGYVEITTANTTGGVYVAADGAGHTIAGDSAALFTATPPNLAGSTISATAGNVAVTFSMRA
jgi:hypothetical protein